MKHLGKLAAWIMTLCMLLTAVSGYAEQTAQYTPGVYEGVGTGMGGEVHVSVEVSADAILSVTVGENNETALVSENALTRIPQDIVKYQSLGVDMVSGATVSSSAVLAAAADALAQAGGDVEALKAIPVTPEKGEDESVEVDVLVIGGGLSGMSAAYETAKAGLETLVIEKLESWGGSSALSGGAVCYATNEDDPTGYFSAENFYQWFQHMGHGQIKDERVKKIAYRSNDTVQWMRNEMGYNPPYEMVETFADGTVARLTNPGSPTEYVTGCGSQMMKIFYDDLQKLEHLTMRNNTKATELLTDENGAVVGAVAEKKDGGKLTVHAKAVVLATGGWTRSEKYMDEWAPGMKKAVLICGMGCDGDGIGLSEAVGAKITSQTSAFAGGVTAALAAAPSNYLLVNGNGERFVAEDTPACYLLAAMMRDSTGVFYELFDEAQSEGMLENASAVVKADTLEELAEKIGADPAVLTATAARYNELKGKEDVDFGKATELMTGIGEGSYYAVPVMNYVLTAYAGPVITDNCEVVSTEGTVIPGLYGVGELIATNIYGYDDGGHGATLQYCMSTGIIAAETIEAAMR